jgi:hypothetical protein
MISAGGGAGSPEGPPKRRQPDKNAKLSSYRAASSKEGRERGGREVKYTLSLGNNA